MQNELRKQVLGPEVRDALAVAETGDASTLTEFSRRLLGIAENQVDWAMTIRAEYGSPPLSPIIWPLTESPRDWVAETIRFARELIAELRREADTGASSRRGITYDPDTAASDRYESVLEAEHSLLDPS